MADIIDVNPNDLMEDFQSAYYNQIGKRMRIGSEEHTLSSIFTYVLSLYSGLINNSYKNQVIETANGVFLDNLAAKYNLNRTPEVYSNPWFEGIFTFDSDCEYYGRGYAKGTLEITVADHVYKNYNAITAATTQVTIRFVAADPHKDYLNQSELIEELKTVEDSNDNNVFVAAALATGYITDLQSVENELSDDDFREYIKSSKYLYVPGIAGSFEALAKNSSKNISDARVIVQGDVGFIPGHVDLICKPKSYIANDKFMNMVKAIDIPIVGEIIAEKNIAVVGQSVNVSAATRVNDTRTYNFFIPEKYNTSEYLSLYAEKFQAVCGYLNNYSLGVNEAFIPSMVLNLMMKPLSEISNDPNDYGITFSDGSLYDDFNKYKDLPIVGLQSVSNYSKRDCSPTSYVCLANNSVGFLAI